MNNSETEKVLDKRVGAKVSASIPKISVVSPAYNVAPFISETLESVFAQSFHDYEILLVNDGSPDTFELEKTLVPFFDRIIYLVQENKGTAAARNTALRFARGEFIAFLDGDDVWLPEYLESQVKYLTEGAYEMVYSDANLFGTPNLGAETYMKRTPSEGEANFVSIVSGKCNVITSGTVISKSRIEEAGLFDESLPKIGMEDFDLWLRIAKLGIKIGYQKIALLNYRVRPDSLSGNNVERARRNIVGLEIVKKKFNLSSDEAAVVEATMKHASAEYHLEQGKAFLMQEKFSEAKTKFKEANAYYHNFKITAACFLLSLSPRLLMFAFRTFRANEMLFIPTSENN